MSQAPVDAKDLEVLAWIICNLYDGASWHGMERRRPEINEVIERLRIFKIGYGEDEE